MALPSRPGGVSRSASVLLAATLLGVAFAGCSAGRVDAKDPPEPKRYKSPVPHLDSLEMRQAVLGQWIRVEPDSSVRRLGKFGLQDREVRQVVIEPFEDRKDPTVLDIERTLASWGHGKGPFRSPTSILADIRIRTQGGDGRDIDTLVVSGHFYQEDAKISGHYLGARDKGDFSIRIVGSDCALINGHPYRRAKTASLPR